MNQIAQVANAPVSAAPIKAGWICLLVTWGLFLIPIPGFGLIGWTINFAAFIVAIVVIARGQAMMGIVQIISSIVVSPLIYFIGLSLMVFILGTQTSNPTDAGLFSNDVSSSLK